MYIINDESFANPLHLKQKTDNFDNILGYIGEFDLHETIT